jgi:hypothetical protein
MSLLLCRIVVTLLCSAIVKEHVAGSQPAPRRGESRRQPATAGHLQSVLEISGAGGLVRMDKAMTDGPEVRQTAFLRFEPRLTTTLSPSPGV